MYMYCSAVLGTDPRAHSVRCTIVTQSLHAWVSDALDRDCVRARSDAPSSSSDAHSDKELTDVLKAICVRMEACRSPAYLLCISSSISSICL